jgi:hypothetical protein
MSFYTGKFYSETLQSAGQGPQACGPNISRPWKAVEIAAMVFGFMVFWPIGLAVVGWKFWQKKSGYQGDLVNFLQERWQRSSVWASRSIIPGLNSSGNSAFDDWREKELARLEEERRKLAAAEQEFAHFMANLRRARDREEFDRFMNERR